MEAGGDGEWACVVTCVAGFGAACTGNYTGRCVETCIPTWFDKHTGGADDDSDLNAPKYEIG